MREIVDINKGYVKIANNLFDNIIFRDFTNRERAVICLIIRLSYGFNHKTAIIKPKSRFTLIGLHRQDINTILKILVDKKVIISYGDNIYALLLLLLLSVCLSMGLSYLFKTGTK